MIVRLEHDRLGNDKRGYGAARQISARLDDESTSSFERTTLGEDRVNLGQAGAQNISRRHNARQSPLRVDDHQIAGARQGDGLRGLL
jgi:hypothetical protein